MRPHSSTAAAARSTPRSSLRSGTKFPQWSGPNAAVELDEPNSSTSDSGWTVGYLDILLLLVTLFAALLGMTYLQQSTPMEQPTAASHSVPLAALVSPKTTPEPPLLLALHSLEARSDTTPFWPTPVMTPPPIIDPRPIPPSASATTEPMASPQGVAVTSEAPPSATSTRPIEPETPEIPAEFERLITWMANYDEQHDLELLLDRDRLQIEVGNEILFPSGSADLSAAGRALLAELTDLIRNDRLHVAVEGHTDNIPINTPRFPSNWELSSIRATSVAHELMTLGVDRQRIRVTGYADTRPRVPNDSAANRALNRRVSLVLELTP